MTHPYMLTASGQHYPLTGPLVRPLVEDIAHHTAQINRFTGAARRPYCVAEHQLLCLEIARAENAPLGAQMAVLTHDGHEAYTTDLSSPAKLAIRNRWPAPYRSDWDEFEELHSNHVRVSLGLTAFFDEFDANVKRWDLIALATERRDLMPDDGEEWAILHGVEAFGDPGRLMGLMHRYASWDQWRDEWLHEYRTLENQIAATAPDVAP